ncbi:hemerythrin domain-containing protein [Ornithinibacillus halophilus]|uniref:Hemerythrin HHE cation binding domain-containing protein n=1 Tax=Ornithinibacillus halophilus TaxID=930117 RepID=A0A1M5CJY6_9BACI|nr:hemerythrin domain-containing protein [Ornithinibacillus halophilus]SHF55019.1 Hemerythrin HHE cation binding domain-containing protein [Ornithinibacillus halophilus]
MVSGPGLKKVDSHAAIHEAALNEARELNRILDHLLKDGKMDKALEIAHITIEHWETRTLRHADAEEKGLYKELVEENPELKDAVVALIRDHDTMRYLVSEIKETIESNTLNDEVLQQFHALVHVDQYHNLEEEKILPEH